MEAVRILKVNLKLAGKPCKWCQVPLELAEEAAVCTACEGEHHRRCWEPSGGCATVECVNAPLRRLDAPGHRAMPLPAAAVLAPGTMHCPRCRDIIMMGSPLCPSCNAVTSPDGLYHGPKTNAPGAVSSLVYGIIGVFICGIIAGPIAISKSSQAKREIASNPTYGGGGLASAGMVLGIVDLVLWAVFLIAKIGG